ncbi:macrolide family glycosyltransferase [Paenibacillus taiwanensis]|uniref:macrolide family glycosyltransferase n=1 Tax=Paenibacillus taiwanensis TaxID=401638 RepID=UPI000429404E|nr:macrolide family glycosyltransferase [Paenibacillus taiwanensis]
MAKMVYFSVDLHGHVNVSLGLIDKLIQRGEEVIYYSSDLFRPRIEAVGAQFRSYEQLISFGLHGGDRLDTFFIFANYILERSQAIIEQLGDDIRSLKPDYIIHDVFCYWGKELGRQLHIPCVSITAPFPYIDEMSEVDPHFFMKMILRSEENSFLLKHKDPADAFRNYLHKSAKLFAHKYKLPEPLNLINDVFCSREDLNILFTSREFQLHSEAFDQRYFFAGYSLYSRQEEVTFQMDWLDGRPLIYVAFGTMLERLHVLYRNCIEAFSDIECQVVMSVGKGIRIDELGVIPDHFRVMSYVPQLAVLEQARIFVNHAGTNSVYESICYHVPQVVIPQAFDEFMGAMMVERAEVGLYLKTQEPSASEIRTAVQTVLADPSYKENCVRVTRSFEATGGLDRAADHIVQYVAAKGSQLTSRKVLNG